MTTTNTYSRQPTKLDYASPTQFKFNIIKLPKVTYFCTQVNVPGVSLGGTIICVCSSHTTIYLFLPTL